MFQHYSYNSFFYEKNVAWNQHNFFLSKIYFWFTESKVHLTVFDNLFFFCLSVGRYIVHIPYRYFCITNELISTCHDHKTEIDIQSGKNKLQIPRFQAHFVYTRFWRASYPPKKHTKAFFYLHHCQKCDVQLLILRFEIPNLLFSIHETQYLCQNIE